ncbi:hypothetical protein, partial [Halorubrum sp. ASP121]|uniref:hypothetical protein n=1 Tax=Halorubrum sp. ASP121 TaxID=1855858 RepID=UPI001A7E0B3C
EDGLERREVRVDVGEQGDLHDLSSALDVLISGDGPHHHGASGGPWRIGPHERRSVCIFRPTAYVRPCVRS